MSRVEDRVAELGLTLPVTSKPVAAYIPAVVTGNLVFTSGQLPMVDGVLPTTGKVGADVDAETAKELARHLRAQRARGGSQRDRVAGSDHAGGEGRRVRGIRPPISPVSPV